MKQDILLVGTGALATLFAARLSEAGYSIHILGTWKQGLDALQKYGARLIDSNGNERAYYTVHATDDVRELTGIKNAVVLVKSWQTERVARQLKECLARDGIALTLQNGLGNRETLMDELGPARTALGIITAGATLLEPGLVKAGGEGVISLERNLALSSLEVAFESSRFKVQIVDDARSLVWGKLVVNAAINPLTAILQVPNGELLSRPNARRVMTALALETAEVANAEIITLPFIDPVFAVEEVARKTAENDSSMLQDIRRGARTEIDAICGAVVQHGDHLGIPTPYNQACWKIVQAMRSSRIDKMRMVR